MTLNLLHLVSASVVGIAAFQTAAPHNHVKHRVSVVQKYARENADDLAKLDVIASTASEPATPKIDMTAENVVIACMDAMLKNDVPWSNAGLETCFDYSSDRCRAALGGSLDKFITYASNPTFGSMTHAKHYSILSVGPIIAAGATRGAMQTVLVKVTPAKGEDRRFLWTLQQERRPPRQGLWLVHECIYVENAFDLTV
ncbi:hypothetical protein HJC23_003530 [Cyclotella cryptica]|uniref:SnoaL-like domain-containing protein n=1 Tax=Cyclotella cryptica TaxID=29204 RepID=A0ABD3NZX9_9STRA